MLDDGERGGLREPGTQLGLRGRKGRRVLEKFIVLRIRGEAVNSRADTAAGPRARMVVLDWDMWALT